MREAPVRRRAHRARVPGAGQQLAPLWRTSCPRNRSVARMSGVLLPFVICSVGFSRSLLDCESPARGSVCVGTELWSRFCVFSASCQGMYSCAKFSAPLWRASCAGDPRFACMFGALLLHEGPVCVSVSSTLADRRERVPCPGGSPRCVYVWGLTLARGSCVCLCLLDSY